MTESGIQPYLNRQTLIIGDVNSGKSTRSASILNLFIQAGYGHRIAVLDFAPDPIQGIGGKLHVAPDTPLLYLTAPIAAPRLMGKDDTHSLTLAKENARKIEALFAVFKREKREILFVNDATLYLQSGSLELLVETLETSPTRIINAYYGSTFKDSALTRRERALTNALIQGSDRVIRL